LRTPGFLRVAPSAVSEMQALSNFSHGTGGF
jgi:hypothetical protein